MSGVRKTRPTAISGARNARRNAKRNGSNSKGNSNSVGNNAARNNNKTAPNASNVGSNNASSRSSVRRNSNNAGSSNEIAVRNRSIALVSGRNVLRTSDAIKSVIHVNVNSVGNNNGRSRSSVSNNATEDSTIVIATIATA